MLKRILAPALQVVLLTGMATFSQAQSIPDQWSFTDNGRKLVLGKQDLPGLYDSATIRSFYLNFGQPNYWQLMTQNYQSGTDIPASVIVDNVTYDSIGVRFKGNTSYMMIQNSQKKSFNLSIDHVHANQDLMGYNTLNLNNSFEDRSFLREVFYLHQIRKHIPAAQANFVHLYINNADWGLYPNVQQMNKDYLKEWYLSNDGAHWRATTGTQGPPGWGDGTAALNFLGSNASTYQQYYTLKSSDVTNPWTFLVDVCDKLNNTTVANLPNVLPAYLDVDRTLWFLASEIAFSDDDSYVYKGKMDYYTYYEPETGRMVPHEFDGNSAFHTQSVTWSPFYHENDANYPLLNKMLQVPAWRQRYIAHMRTIITEELDVNSCNAMLDNYQTMIDALVQSDPKKIYTYANFISEITVLKNFVNTRRTNLLANTEVAEVAPVIANAYYHNSTNQQWVVPEANEEAHITTDVTSTNGIFGVKLYYSTELVGNFTETAMYDDGAHNDGAAGDGTYGATIPGQPAGTWVRYYVEAASNNTAHSVSYLPVGAEHDVYVYNIAPIVAPNPGVVINELMAANVSSFGDDAGDFDDWIELYNKSTQPIDISGFFLTDNIGNLDKWEIPAGTVIPADGYLIYWADEDSAQGTNHANFKLSASGEILYLLNAAGQLIDSVSWGDQPDNMGFARVPNGTGNFITQIATFAFNNENTSVEDIASNDANMSVYPNPVSSSVTILIPTAGNGKEIIITNSVGQQVYSKVAEINNTIDMSALSSGMYVVMYNGKAMKLMVRH